MNKSLLTDRRGTTATGSSAATASSIAFDFGNDAAGRGGSSSSRSQTSGNNFSISSAWIGRLRLGVMAMSILGALALVAAVLLRQDDINSIVASGEGAAASAVAAASAASEVRDAVGNDASRTRTSTSTSPTAAAADSSILTLQAPLGNIRIRLRPDLSPESVDYVRSVVQSGTCDAHSCRWYRAERPGILQGVLKSGTHATESGRAIAPNAVFGNCPAEYQNVTQVCPPHDPRCGCHGPVMVRGDVGWAGGTAGGPDFFVNTHDRPAVHSGNQHTVWGHVDAEDDESFATIAKCWELPSRDSGGMRMLVEEVPFQAVMGSS